MDVFPVALRNEENTEDRFETELRTTWNWILEQACDHGWEPAGTLAPSDWRSMNYDDGYVYQFADYATWDLPGSYDRNDNFKPDRNKIWSGTYLTDQGQGVTAEDANSLADALELSLAKTTKNVISIPAFAWTAGARSVNELLAREAEGLQGFYDRIPELVAFCRRGSFTIS